MVEGGLYFGKAPRVLFGYDPTVHLTALYYAYNVYKISPLVLMSHHVG